MSALNAFGADFSTNFSSKMISEISITAAPHEENDSGIILGKIKKALSLNGINAETKKIIPVLVKKSVDARRRQVKLILRYKVYIDENPADAMSSIPLWKKAGSEHTVIIVGSGPAGLFGALKLLEYGIRPVIIERGSEVYDRKRDIAAIGKNNLVDSDSNYCFGEGGAGTFSDGKLYTRSSKRGDISSILKIFVHFGADKKILTDAHPHIGTDKLPQIIKAMRTFIISMGGEFHFNTKMTGFITEKPAGTKNAIPVVKGIKTVNTTSGSQKEFTGDAVLLATGHSASDIYEILSKEIPGSLEAKTFAIGVRVEHPRELIDKIQYHGQRGQHLGAAEYRLTSQQNERGVYSFCMCPGGFVVPSATEPDGIVVNGMSAAGRNSVWSNAAIVVETRPEDIPTTFTEMAVKNKSAELAGLYFRRYIEKETAAHGDGQKAPAQKLIDFLEGKLSAELPKSSYAPGLVSSRLDEWLPKQIVSRLKSGFTEFGRKMQGFVSNDAVLIASETRTSTPVRILRDKTSFECSTAKHLYPAGEGSGYSGGIVSSAMDGKNACTEIACLITH